MFRIVAGNVTADVAVARWRIERVARLLIWVPLTLGGAYLVVLATQLDRLIVSTYLNADAASAPVIGQLYSSGPPHREVVLGQMAWFSTLMFELATRWLPAHRAIWEAAPYAMALASAALIAWGLWQLAGRWAAAIGGVIVLCASPRTLQLLFSLNDHSPTWFSLALLAALLVLLQRGGVRRLHTGPLRTPAVVAIVVVVGLIVGANMASDPLLIVAGVLPALLAAAGAWALRPGRGTARAWWLMLATLVPMAVGDVLTGALMRHDGVKIGPSIAHNLLASGEAVVSNFTLWWQSVSVLGNGNFYGQRLGFTSGLQLICALLSLVVVAFVAPRIVWQELRDALRARRGAGAEGARVAGGARPAEGAWGDEGARGVEGAWIAWCIFWGATVLLLSLSFIASSNPADIESDRYLVGLVLAVAALVPLVARRGIGQRMLVTAGVSVFALTGLSTLLRGDATATGTLPSSRELNEIVAVAHQEHLSIGYAGYWDAAPITWAAHTQVQVFPVQLCGASLCRFALHYISSWYVPRPGRRTFLISDPTQPSAAPPVGNLGRPIAVRQIGATTMYVYPYDIASRIQP
jgi:hypothetical protein